ncbi:MAG: hypothetical protein CSYNP_02586 [Syntrophus sp. SKADARSKE-3]|nr:hypothetical protein [Syntrophus sp. SKADARSKE-3]
MLVYAGLCGDITYTYGVFLPSMSDAFHWSRTAFSGPYTVFLILSGMLSPMAGITISRFGAKNNILLGNMAATIGLLGMSQVSDLWQVYFFFGILASIGIAFGEFIPLTSVINYWFTQKRSLAMGLLFASCGVGGFVMPPFISAIILTFGWRWAWAILAAVHLLLTVIAGGLIIRNRPEDYGQVINGNGEADGQATIRPSKSGPVYSTARDWTVGEALRTRALWMITAVFSVILFATNLLTTHQVAYLQDLHHTPMVSATALGLMLGMSIIGRLLGGILGMRYEGHRLAGFFFGLMGLGLVALLYAQGIGFVYLYSILAGLGVGGAMVLMPNMLAPISERSTIRVSSAG